MMVCRLGKGKAIIQKNTNIPGNRKNARKCMNIPNKQETSCHSCVFKQKKNTLELRGSCGIHDTT